jgi:hypothetical protein
MDRPDSDILSEWHIALNQHNHPQLREGEKFDREKYKSWMYDAKHMADEIPRLSNLFRCERLGQLPKLHRQCSQSDIEPIKDNHLTCCLGVECRKCEALLALEKADLPPEKIDELKAWTCAAHILGEKAKRMIDDSEGFVLTTGDRMFWERVYSSLSSDLG